MKLTPDQIMQQMIKSGRTLQSKNDELVELGTEMAEAEYAYDVAFAKKMLDLKAADERVTLIEKLARGDKHVADMRMKLNIAETLYNACREKIKDLRSEIDVMRSFLTWEREEYRNANIT